jgi:tetratricopeptide (TPR) repeat protein
MSSANYYASLTPKPAKKRGAWIVIFITSLLVVVPVVIKEIPREHARWYQAAATEYLERGQFDSALQQVGRALELDPEQYRTYLLQARIYEKRYTTTDSKSSADDLARAFDCIALARNKAAQEGQQLIVELHAAELAHNVKRWKVAADHYKNILDTITVNTYLRAQMLNGYAYNAALANVDLDAALADIEEALDLVSDQRGLGKDDLADAKASFLDTRGYIHYRRGEYSPAIADIEQSLKLFEPVKDKKLEKAKGNLVRAHEIQRVKDEINRAWAVMLYHRALVNEVLAVDEPERILVVVQDLARIKALGQTPGTDLY